MSVRRAQSTSVEKPPKNRCIQFLCLSWKVFTCVFSHVTLVTSVVAYCISGAYLFEMLEKENEKQVKLGISSIRNHVTEDIWNFTFHTSVLHEHNWTEKAIQRLQMFENTIIKEMKDRGWDGNEEENQVQWTWAGALFYSIIVITTIGYGHISPKTFWGKVATIFYAIVGIPLMLLCLSNIGDIMASSFRFLYWRVCCYVCTREPKRNHRGSRARSSFRSQSGRSVNHASSQLRRSVRISQRSNDSGFPQFEALQHAYSDTDCRYSIINEQKYADRLKLQKMLERDTPDKQNSERHKRRNYRHRTSNTIERERSFDIDYSNTDDEYTKDDHKVTSAASVRAQSLDRKGVHDPPVYCNKYAIKNLDSKRSKSMPRHVLPRNDESFLDDMLNVRSFTTDDELDDMREKRIGKRRERPKPASSARIMSPMGFAVHRQAKHLAQVKDGSSDDEWDINGDASNIVRPVPIWLCVFLVISYILGGAYLFSEWEKWSFLDSAYFCFITLTTIGFGDFVPAQGMKENSEVSIAMCSLYLLFGIALLAMSFNLVQEEVIANVKSVARRLGILKEEEYEDQY